MSVLPSLHIHVTSGELTTEESLLLDAWVEKTEDQAWRLDRQRAIRSIEKGLNTMELIDFLKVRDDQPLPESVESFLRTCQPNGSALKIAGSAILIHCQDTKTATTIATHKETAGLCLKAGKQQLVVRLEHKKNSATW